MYFLKHARMWNKFTNNLRINFRAVVEMRTLKKLLLFDHKIMQYLLQYWDYVWWEFCF